MLRNTHVTGLESLMSCTSCDVVPIAASLPSGSLCDHVVHRRTSGACLLAVLYSCGQVVPLPEAFTVAASFGKTPSLHTHVESDPFPVEHQFWRCATTYRSCKRINAEAGGRSFALLQTETRLTSTARSLTGIDFPMPTLVRKKLGFTLTCQNVAACSLRRTSCTCAHLDHARS